MVQITDNESAETWAGQHPLDTQVWLGVRAALRAFPVQPTSAESRDVDYSSILFSLRALVICAVFSRATPDEKELLRRGLSGLPNSATAFFARSALSAASTAGSEETSSRQLAYALRFSGEALRASIGGPIDEGMKAAYLEASSDTKQRLHTWPNLWNDESDTKKSVLARWRSVSNELLRDDNRATWGFWFEWYEGFLKGAPLDWETQKRIALIDDVIWSNGPEAVAKEIEKIRALRELEARIEELETERTALQTYEPRLGIGGNNPPEDMQIEPQIVRQTEIIWAAIDDLKTEGAKANPDRGIVTQATKTLSNALAAIAKWCGRKGDLAVDTLIKWGLPVGGAAIIARPDLVEAVVEAAKAWLPFI